MSTLENVTCVYCEGDAFSTAPCPEQLSRTGHKMSCLTAPEKLVMERRRKAGLAKLLEEVRNSPRSEARRQRPSIWGGDK